MRGPVDVLLGRRYQRPCRPRILGTVSSGSRCCLARPGRRHAPGHCKRSPRPLHPRAARTDGPRPRMPPGRSGCH